MMTDEMKKEIVLQMGGFGKLKAMIGAEIMFMPNGISIKFKGSRKTDCLYILYTGETDSYDLVFYKGFKIVKNFKDIYCDQLKNIFEETTGLYLSL